MFFLTIRGDFRAFRRAVYAFLACTAVAFVVLPRDSTEFRFDKVRSTGRIGDPSLGGNQSPEGSEKGCSGGRLASRFSRGMRVMVGPCAAYGTDPGGGCPAPSVHDEPSPQAPGRILSVRFTNCRSPVRRAGFALGFTGASSPLRRACPARRAPRSIRSVAPPGRTPVSPNRAWPRVVPEPSAGHVTGKRTPAP
ncbi:hypothetical protein [Embleya sp. NPDC059259]|uniref:hypothetical protein n=1 Tax=unclassified Embleya TaxID=2699296 RepID=UPI00369C7567